jgi:hypothetical protein
LFKSEFSVLSGKIPTQLPRKLKESPLSLGTSFVGSGYDAENSAEKREPIVIATEDRWS